MTSTDRITLSRIIAVNWYGYRQFIDVEGLSLITGANGSGKSALLDLIQFVMLGEQQSKFNKAAAGAGSGRTLRGYCLCDTNTTARDGQERFLRPSGVTIAALEFKFPQSEHGEDTAYQTWGARIEYDGPTARGKILWFRIPRRLEKIDFLHENTLLGDEEFMPEDQFRVHLKRDLEGDSWEHQRTYLEEMRLRTGLHFDREQMNKTLPKAMAFQPENNFESFIREFLLEAAMPDVKAVKASVDAHRRASERLAKMHDQHQRLEQICQLHMQARKHHREGQVWAHLKDALVHEEIVERLDHNRVKWEENLSDHANQTQLLEDTIAEREELRERLEQVRLVVGQDSQAARLKEDRDKLARLQTELIELREARKVAAQFLANHAMRWKDWLRFGESLGIETSREAQEQLTIVRGNDEVRGLDAIARLGRSGDGMLMEAREKLRVIELEVRRLELRETELVRDLDYYDAGRATASPLLDALKSRGQKAVSLSRVVEVKPEAESWWPLLETLLGENRQAILAENYQAAWDEAQRTQSFHEILINPKELDELKPTVQPGSLRSFFETKHQQASKLLDHLVGEIMPVDHLSGLDRFANAISKDGWLKEAPKRTRILPSRELTLGEEGLRRLRQNREQELHHVRTDLALLRRERSDWKGWMDSANDQGLLNPEPPQVNSALRRLPDAERERQSLEETIRLLATPEREAAVKNLRRLEAEERSVTERAARLDERVRGLAQQQREVDDLIRRLEEESTEAEIQRSTSRASLKGILDSEINERLRAALDQISSWPKRFEIASEMARQENRRADDTTRQRDEARQQLSMAHTEISDAFDPLDDDNDRYELRLRELAEQELERYQVEAEKARLEWEDRLQHQVLDVLRDKLNEAERTKRELNKAMQHEIGGIRYQITSRADKAHSAIWALVEKGLPSGPDLDLFNDAAKSEIEKAKEELMAAIEAADNPEEKKAQRALDYRYYHHWDIEARPVGKGDEAAISLNKSAKKQSGGENQAPFFVAMLAAFHRVYDVGGKGGPATLSIVVMDEAFSKLSGDRISDCLALARNFGLQLVMAFPEDRLPTMIEHADTVVQCRVERDYNEATGAVRRIENWVVRVNREKLRAALA